jgi:hypothetical protein
MTEDRHLAEGPKDGAHAVPDRPAPFRVRAHIPSRPLWLCRVCACPWPCATARLTLKAEYADNHVALSIYLGSAMHEAVADLYRLNPDTAPDPATMFGRFLGWAPPRPPT